MDRPLIPRPAYRPGQPLRMEIIDDATAAIYKRMTPVEKFEHVHRLISDIRGMLECSLRGQHPSWTSAQIALELARRSG